MLKQSIIGLVLVLLSCTGITGCGNSDSEIYHVRGTVTLQGTPIPAGSIQFIPAPGNSGPSGYAEIVDGQFDTSAAGSKGTVGGPHRVIIQGFDGKTNLKAELPLGKPIVQDYNTEYEVPKEDESTQHFRITATGSYGS